MMKVTISLYTTEKKPPFIIVEIYINDCCLYIIVPIEDFSVK